MGTSSIRRPLPAAAVAVALAITLLLHGALLGLLPLEAGVAAEQAVRPVMRARRIVLTPETVPPAAPAPAAPRPPAKAPPAAPVAATRAAEAPAAAEAAEASAPVEVVAPLDPAASVPAAADAGGWQLPTFATRLPPGAVLRFEVRRGGFSGDGVLAWQPRAQGYAMAMTASAFGTPFITWVSEGGIDAHGIAPTRFVDQRRARDARAANFQREAGVISFSGPAVEFPLVPGAQDRLSWMVQVPAIIAAAPEAFPAGARIPLFVVGARGDGDVWTFVVQGHEATDVAGSRVQGALKLLREPRRPFDTQVELWLDPERHHLPVRVRMTLAQTGEGNEFLLREMAFGPGP